MFIFWSGEKAPENPIDPEHNTEEAPMPQANRAQEAEQLAEKVKGLQFNERLSTLGFQKEEMKGEDINKLEAINERINQLDAPWVVRIMGEIKRKAGEDHLLKSFGPEDVNVLAAIAQERGKDFSKEGIVSADVKDMAVEFQKRKSAPEEPPVKSEEPAVEEPKSKKQKSPFTLRPLRWRFTRVAEAPKAEIAKEERRGETHDEIARHLVENPGEALSIFKKGVGLKLEKAAIDFTKFWEKSGAKALKGLSFAGEKAVGYPAGEMHRAVWNVAEWLDARPGIGRLDDTLKIHDQIERLRKGGEAGQLTQEQTEQLAKLLELHKHAARGQWEEVQAFNAWHEKKINTLKALHAFGNAREKLNHWIMMKRAEGAVKKEKVAGKRAKEVSEKLKA